jgi:hypothetical protein
MAPGKRRPPARSEIAGNAFYFPVAVTHWLGTVAAIDFLAGRGMNQSAKAAARFGLGERPPRRWTELAVAHACNRETTCLAFRPSHLHPRGAGGRGGASSQARGFHSQSSPICWAKSNGSC